MENYIISEEKNIIFFYYQNPFFLLKELNKACTFIHNPTFKYILHTIVNTKSLVPLLLKITTSKNISLFLKNMI